MRFVSRFNPVGGVSDFIAYFRQPTPHRWPILAASFAMTFGLLYAFTSESVFVPPEPPKVVYISTFAEDRTDAEIRQSNIANQKLKEQREKAYAEAEQRAIDAYAAIGRASGMDVDSMEAQAAIARRREQAAERARLKELYGAGRTGADRAE